MAEKEKLGRNFRSYRLFYTSTIRQIDQKNDIVPLEVIQLIPNLDWWCTGSFRRRYLIEVWFVYSNVHHSDDPCIIETDIHINLDCNFALVRKVWTKAMIITTITTLMYSCQEIPKVVWVTQKKLSNDSIHLVSEIIIIVRPTASLQILN